jgi:hypothetical protein
MKKLLLALFAAGILVPLTAQESAFTAMTFNGATGIYVVPSARIGFADANVGFNVGYHTNIFKPRHSSTDLNHLIQTNLSFLKMFEVSGTFDIQPSDYKGSDPNDVIAGFKFQLPFTAIPVALGGNFQYRNIGRSGDHWAAQTYAAVTYPAEIFSWPSETTMTVGHTFIQGDNNSDIDFGMGFDLVIFPNQLRSLLHALIDYSNYSYNVDPWGVDARNRGVLNTGVRVDFSQIPALNKFTLALDIFVADAFDSNKTGQGRSIGTGLTFGMSF